MLDLLRRKAQSPYLQATVLIIIVVFVFWGVGGNQSGARNAVATVNGEPITLQEFDRALQQRLDQYSSQFGGNLPKGFMEALDIKRQVVNELIQKSLLLQGGEEMGMYVSDMEIQNAIKDMTVFQNNGVFDVSRYKEVLKGSRLTPKKFEAGLRSDLLGTKAGQGITSFARVMPSETNDRFTFDNSELRIEYVTFKAADFKDQVSVSEEAVGAYFEKNKETYKTSPQIKVKFLSFLFENEKENLTIPASEIEGYYASHQEEFGQPEKRKARHILLRTTDQNKEARKKEIESIWTRAKSGEDFAALAREFSEDGSAAQGGDLGFFSRGQMVKPFEDAVFSMEKGGISDIVTTQFGFHIIQLDEIQPADIQSLALVRNSIEEKLKTQQAKNSAFEKANGAYEKIIFAGSLANYSEKFNATLSETDFFPQDSPPDGLGKDPSIIATAFSLKKGELSSLLDSTDGYTILFIEDVKDPEIPELATVREKVEKDFISDQAKNLAAATAKEALAAVRDGGDLFKTAQEKDMEVQVSDYFSRNKKQSGSLPGQLLDKAISLTADSPYPAEIFSSLNSFYVYRFKDFKEAPQDNQQERTAFESQLALEKNKQILDAWITHLMKKSKVGINEKYLQ